MPGNVAKVDGYRTRWGGKVTAKKTSKRKAQAQLNLLRGVEHGWKPTGAPAKYKRKKAVRETREVIMPEKDEAISRTKYAAYRRIMAVSPDTIINTLSYNKWKKQEAEKKTAKPGK